MVANSKHFTKIRMFAQVIVTIVGMRLIVTDLGSVIKNSLYKEFAVNFHQTAKVRESAYEVKNALKSSTKIVAFSRWVYFKGLSHCYFFVRYDIGWNLLRDAMNVDRIVGHLEVHFKRLSSNFSLYLSHEPVEVVIELVHSKQHR